MSVTAARLGSSPLMLDWSGILKNPKSISGSPASKAAFEEVWKKLKVRFDAKEVGFYDAPMTAQIHQLPECQAMAQKILNSGNFTDALFLGIGGSSLGPISLLSALPASTKSPIKVQFIENPDPTDWKARLSQLNPQTTLIVCVTKSGTTFETMAQFLLGLEWLGFERWKTHTVAITDPKNGDLKKFATEHEIQTLHIDPSMGGRFSIFTPVGLFPALLAGLDAEAFLKGASQVRDYVEKTSAEKNALFQIGSDLVAHFDKRPIHVCMPYTTLLKSFGSWFVQLWGESLGKDLKGFTPLAALGATDQHSILQLLRDGPDDKVTFFLTVDRVADEIKIPHLNRLRGKFNSPTPQAFQILEGHTLHELLRVEYRAISLVLTKRNRPQFTWNLEDISERSMGALYFAASVMTAFTGTYWGVNPFDQPGVEEGKIYIRDALSKAAQDQNQRSEDDDHSPVARLRTYANREREPLE
jgi:glucose-6-phosphate isomerase